MMDGTQALASSVLTHHTPPPTLLPSLAVLAGRGENAQGVGPLAPQHRHATPVPCATWTRATRHNSDTRRTVHLHELPTRFTTPYTSGATHWTTTSCPWQAP